jgi:hypothetical protein
MDVASRTAFRSSVRCEPPEKPTGATTLTRNSNTLRGKSERNSEAKKRTGADALKRAF